MSHRQFVLSGTVALMALATLGVATGAAAPPAPCNAAPQITDANGDGHHASTDVLAAWFSEAAGHLQAVIQVRAGTWVPEHDDAEVNGSGYALLFTVNGQTQFVRATAPPPEDGPVRYDFGTYTRGSGFVSAGATTGAVEAGTGGTVTIDIPAVTGAVTGAALATPFVLTYDGITAGVPDWVDHAPGGDSPDDTAVGADYRVGSCAAGPTGTPTPTGPAPITGVQLSATKRITGGGTATVSGKVSPARAGVAVALTRAAHSSVTTRLTTQADGSFSARIPVKETTRLRAVADRVGSQTLTVTVRSTVRITVRRLRSGTTRVTGTVRPALPGRVLWLRTTSATPSARGSASYGRLTFSFKHPRRGRYQAVFIPSDDRAERSTSNTGVIR